MIAVFFGGIGTGVNAIIKDMSYIQQILISVLTFSALSGNIMASFLYNFFVKNLKRV
jgi:hypothetical protein